MKSSDLLKRLPSIDEILENPQVRTVVDRLNQSTVTSRVRSFLDELREEASARAEGLPLPSLREVIDRVTRYVARDSGWQLAGAVNATGRFRGGAWAAAPLADAAVERVLLLSKDYAVESGQGPSTAADAVAAVQRLTGAEAAAVFNSRAGALWLTLTELACQPPLVVARGELGEVDPGCRLTNLCDSAGARMREVGGPDAVTVDDYRAALGEDDGVVLRLAPEAYRVVGGAPRPTTAEMAHVAHRHGGLLIEDLAGGALVELPGIEGMSLDTAKAAFDAGADLVLVRGDGLVGGPACCVALGRRDLIDRLLARPLAAAYRPSVADAAALAATLELLEDRDSATLKIPLLSLLSTPLENLRTRAERLAPQIAASPAVAAADVTPLGEDSTVVSGLPVSAPSIALSITPSEGDAGSLSEKLRSGSPAIGFREEADRLLFDLRTVFPRQDLALVSAFPEAEADENPSNGESAP